MNLRFDHELLPTPGHLYLVPVLGYIEFISISSVLLKRCRNMNDRLTLLRLTKLPELQENGQWKEHCFNFFKLQQKTNVLMRDCVLMLSKIGNLVCQSNCNWKGN